MSTRRRPGAAGDETVDRPTPTHQRAPAREDAPTRPGPRDSRRPTPASCSATSRTRNAATSSSTANSARKIARAPPPVPAWRPRPSEDAHGQDHRDHHDEARVDDRRSGRRGTGPRRPRGGADSRRSVAVPPDRHPRPVAPPSSRGRPPPARRGWWGRCPGSGRSRRDGWSTTTADPERSRDRGSRAE